jgi:hypothetical protein
METTNQAQQVQEPEEITLTLSTSVAKALLAVLHHVGGAGKARENLYLFSRTLATSLGGEPFGEYEFDAWTGVTTKPPQLTSWRMERGVFLFDCDDRGFTIPPKKDQWGYKPYAREMRKRVEEKYACLSDEELAAAKYAQENNL